MPLEVGPLHSLKRQHYPGFNNKHMEREISVLCDAYVSWSNPFQLFYGKIGFDFFVKVSLGPRTHPKSHFDRKVPSQKIASR